MYDLLIKNGVIIDGSGEKTYSGSVGIKAGKIASVGDCPESSDVIIDADEMVIAPGFIDAHTHADVTLLIDGSAETALRQGCTSLSIGNCGGSNYPINERNRRSMEDGLSKEFYPFEIDPSKLVFDDFTSYKSALQDSGVAVNVIPLIGYATIRSATIGITDAHPDKFQRDQMKSYLEEALVQGVFGMSTGLEYAPQIFSTTEELIELSRILSKYNRIYVSHIRNMYDDLVGGVKEAIQIAKEAGGRVHLSHMQVNGYQNRGSVKDAVKVIDEAVKEGIKISYDLHPWEGGMSPSVKPLPAWVKAEGDIGIVKRLQDPETVAKIRKEMEENPYYARYDEIFFPQTKNPQTSGKFLTEIAKIHQTDPIDALFTVIKEEGGSSTIIEFTMYEEDILAALTYPDSVIGSDNTTVPRGMKSNHPRHVCCFPYLIEKYVNKDKVLSLSQMVSKMTGKTAAIFELSDRGLLKEGYWADIVIFDSKNMKSNMDYRKPDVRPTGISTVIVNGVVAFKDGEVTENRQGIVLEP